MTHEVLNQPPVLEGWNLYLSDPVLEDAVGREGAKWGHDSLVALGERAGSPEVLTWGEQANRFEPELRTHDRYGHRLDEVDFHPSWHSLMDLSVSHGLHALHWQREPGEGAHVLRTVLFHLMAQVEAGHGCPISMTAAAIPALRHQPDLAEEWEPRLTSRSYDPRSLPATEKLGNLFGMGMTEKQGGSDVRANTTRAEASNGGGPGGEYRITGHKWFTSAPMCDGFLVLAQAPGGLSCFLLPRFTPDGERNAIRIQRLKDKLGNRSNASSELEFDGAYARMVGEEGRGVPTIIEMVNGTRLDCVTGSAGLMRQAVSQAAWHVSHRWAFGSALIDKPLMQNVIADLEVEAEAAQLMMVRLAGAFDRAEVDETEAAFRRIATPVAKYWVTKRCTPVVREAMECLGGNGYVEEFPLARMYRESPLNAIWEGSGNVIALDLLRVMAKQPQSLEAFLADLEQAEGADRRLDAGMRLARRMLEDVHDPELEARRSIEILARAWAGALLVRHGDPDVADAYCASRLAGDWGAMFGTLPTGIATESIARRAVPSV